MSPVVLPLVTAVAHLAIGIFDRKVSESEIRLSYIYFQMFVIHDLCVSRGTQVISCKLDVQKLQKTSFPIKGPVRAFFDFHLKVPVLGRRHRIVYRCSCR